MNIEHRESRFSGERKVGSTPVIFFSITDLCNSKCITCNYWQNKEDGGFLNHDTILETVDGLAKRNPQTIYFTGGEPLIRARQLFQITEDMKTRYPNIQLRLYTNGVLMHKFMDQIVSTFDIVNISIDSFNPEIYKDIRGIGGLPIILKNINMLKERNRDTVVRVNTVIQKRNYRQLPTMVQQAEKSGANYITFLPLDYKSQSFSRKENQDLSSELLGPVELEEFKELVAQVTDPAYLAEHPILREHGEDLLKIVRYYEEVNELRPTVNPACDTPENTAIIDSYGYVRLCFFTDSVGSLRENTMEEILTSGRNIKTRGARRKTRKMQKLHLSFGIQTITSWNNS